MSRIIAKAKIASRMAPNAGIYSAACQSLNHAIPNRNSSGGMPPPTLCAQFHTETIPPRSFCDHQCTMVRPHGGQPIPSEPAAEEQQHEHYHDAGRRHGTKPITSITSAARIKPAGRKMRGFERSETDPMMNFEIHRRWRYRKGRSRGRHERTLLDKIRHRQGKVLTNQIVGGITKKMPIKICQRNRRYSGSISAAGKRALCAAGLKILNISASVALAVFY